MARKSDWRRTVLPVLIFLLFTGAAAYFFIRGSGNDGPEGRRSRGVPITPVGEIAVAYPEEPLSLIPYSFSGDSNSARDLLRPVMPTLLGVTPQGEYVPYAVSRVPSGSDIGGDPFSVTFHLNPEASWGDGTRLTSRDVQFTWELLKSNGTPSSGNPYRRISEFVVLDDRAFRLVFDAPYPAWKDLFSSGDFILPRHLLEGKDLSATFASGPPTSAGPYRIAQWTRGLEIVYEVNPRWWGETPFVSRIRVFFVPSLDTAVELLTEDRVQMIVSTTELSVESRLEGISGVETAGMYGASWWELGFNTSSDKISSRARRAAIAAGVDRQEIGARLIRDAGRPLQSILPGRAMAPSFAQYAYSKQSVAALIRSHGNPGKLAISAPRDSEIAATVQRAVHFQLKEVGITTELRNPQQDQFYGDWLLGGAFDLALWERRGTPSSTLAARFLSTLVPPSGPNYSRMKSQSADGAMEAAVRTKSFVLEADVRAHDLVAELLPVLPLFESRMVIANRDSLTGMKPNAFVEGPFWNSQDWRIR